MTFYLHTMAPKPKTKTRTDAEKAQIKELSELAREAAAIVMECDEDEVAFVIEDSSHVVPLGSTLIYIYPKTKPIEPSCLIIEAKLLSGLEDPAKAKQLLANVNQSVELGTVKYVKGNIMYVHEMEYPVIDDLVEAIESFMTIANALDDRLQSRLGGSRTLESAEDEVWL